MTPQRSIRICLLSIHLALAASHSAQGAPTSVDPEVRNVLLITADDLGLQLSCYGETTIETPQLDALAASGVRLRWPT